MPEKPKLDLDSLDMWSELLCETSNRTAHLSGDGAQQLQPLHLVDCVRTPGPGAVGESLRPPEFGLQVGKAAAPHGGQDLARRLSRFPGDTGAIHL